MFVQYQQFVSKAFPVAALALGLMLSPAHAEPGETASAPGTDGLEGAPIIESAPVAAVVRGIAADDLLNVRATASPIGLVLARVPNGSDLTRFECAEVRGYEWCRVELPGLEGLVGWTPARYLRVALPEGGEMAELPKPLPRPEPIDATKITVGIMPDPLPMPDDPLADAPPATVRADVDAPLLAQDPADEARKVDGAAAQLALALATRANPASIEVYSGGETAAAEAEETAVDVPIPTPRPRRPGEPEPEAALTVAALDAGDDDGNGRPSAEPLREEMALPAPADAVEAPAPVATPVPSAEIASVPQPDTPHPAPEPVAAEAAPAAPAKKTAEAPAPSAAAVESPRPARADAIAAPVAAEEKDEESSWRDQIVALLPSWGRGGGASAEAAEAEPAPASEPTVSDAAPERSEPAPGATMAALAEPAVAPTPSTPPVVALPAPAAVVPAAAAPAPARPVSVAQASSAPAGKPAWDVVAEVPCARYVGQPMTRCEARVDRLNADDADVTIVWPDGGTRVVRFREGRPESANSRSEFRFVREAELNLIRVGSGERFEILDGLLYAE